MQLHPLFDNFTDAELGTNAKAVEGYALMTGGGAPKILSLQGHVNIVK